MIFCVYWLHTEYEIQINLQCLHDKQLAKLLITQFFNHHIEKYNIKWKIFVLKYLFMCKNK